MDEDNLPEVFVCEECNEVFEGIFDYIVHKGDEISIPINIGGGIALDFWTIMQEVYYMIEDTNYDEALDVLESIAATIYASSTGVLRKELEEALVESFVSNLDDKLKEFLDEQTNNDK
jgi:hypothetical protein